MLRRMAWVTLLVGCGGTPRPEGRVKEPADLIDPATYATRVAGLRATLARSNVLLDTQPVIETCGSHHGISDCVRCEVARRVDTADVDPDIIDEVAIAFGRYPSRVLVAAGLAHVALCRSIHYAHDEVAPSGMAVLEDGRMLISLEHFTNRTHALYAPFTIEQVVHHELFHLLDHAIRGAATYADREWYALNPPGFSYPDPAAGPATGSRRPSGFPNSYATTNELEDRASVFEYVMGQPDELCAIARVDPIVAAKTRMVWRRISNVMGDGMLRRHAPCVDGILAAAHPQPRPSAPVRPRRTPHRAPAPRPGRLPAPASTPHPTSLLGKMR